MNQVRQRLVKDMYATRSCCPAPVAIRRQEPIHRSVQGIIETAAFRMLEIIGIVSRRLTIFFMNESIHISFVIGPEFRGRIGRTLHIEVKGTASRAAFTLHKLGFGTPVEVEQMSTNKGV